MTKTLLSTLLKRFKKTNMFTINELNLVNYYLGLLNDQGLYTLFYNTNGYLTLSFLKTGKSKPVVHSFDLPNDFITHLESIVTQYNIRNNIPNSDTLYVKLDPSDYITRLDGKVITHKQISNRLNILRKSYRGSGK